MLGRRETTVKTPTAAALWVSLKISQAAATVCIQSPAVASALAPTTRRN